MRSPTKDPFCKLCGTASICFKVSTNSLEAALLIGATSHWSYKELTFISNTKRLSVTLQGDQEITLAVFNIYDAH